MSAKSDASLADRIVHAFKDHPVGAMIVIVAILTLSIAKFTDAFDQLRARVSGRDPATDRVYNSIKYDLRQLQGQFEVLRRGPLPLNLSPQDSMAVLLNLRRSVVSAKQACRHSDDLEAMDDSVGVRWIRWVCGFADHVQTADSLSMAWQRDGGYVLTVGYTMALGVSAFLKDSAGALVAGEWRPRKRF